MDEPLIVLQLSLTPSEISSLLMAQITQARHSRVTLGENSPVTRIDRNALEKLMVAQKRALGALGD